ncbi:hypothetical protein DH09_15630 [Bacillaceae bacterium JMAK1]|nr:hypothetical protein DH09_15630 [Bacillaceae bacterium JMAK1]
MNRMQTPIIGSLSLFVANALLFVIVSLTSILLATFLFPIMLLIGAVVGIIASVRVWLRFRRQWQPLPTARRLVMAVAGSSSYLMMVGIGVYVYSMIAYDPYFSIDLLLLSSLFTIPIVAFFCSIYFTTFRRFQMIPVVLGSIAMIATSIMITSYVTNPVLHIQRTGLTLGSYTLYEEISEYDHLVEIPDEEWSQGTRIYADTMDEAMDRQLTIVTNNNDVTSIYSSVNSAQTERGIGVYNYFDEVFKTYGPVRLSYDHEMLVHSATYEDDQHRLTFYAGNSSVPDIITNVQLEKKQRP